jgi:FKBP-type peptidyl-prolyl cis-trans isomerase 2
VKVDSGKRVRLKVELKVVGGEVIEKSVIEYIQGGGAMLQALEDQVHGCEAGAKKSGVIPAEQAFGDPRAQVRKVLAKKEFPQEAQFEVGMRFQAKDATAKQDVVLQIDKVLDDTIEVVICHPLADKDIAYQFEVLAVTDPTPPPLPPDLLGAVEDAE